MQAIFEERVLRRYNKKRFTEEMEKYYRMREKGVTTS